MIPTLGITAAKPLGLNGLYARYNYIRSKAIGYVRVPGCAARLPHAPGIIGPGDVEARPGVWLSHRSGAGSGPGWEYIDIVPHVSRTRSGNWLPFAERSGTPFRTEPFRCRVPFWRTNLAYIVLHIRRDGLQVAVTHHVTDTVESSTGITPGKIPAGR